MAGEEEVVEVEMKATALSKEEEELMAREVELWGERERTKTLGRGDVAVGLAQVR